MLSNKRSRNPLQLFIDLRWLRGGSLRGIGHVSLMYLQEILASEYAASATLITTKSSEKFLRSWLVQKSITSPSIEISSVVFGDLLGIRRIIQSKTLDQKNPIYISFGNTIASKWGAKFIQICLLHDFSWDRKRFKNISSKLSMGDLYYKINHLFNNKDVNRYIFVSQYLNSLLLRSETYRYRSSVVMNPLEPLSLPAGGDEYDDSNSISSRPIRVCWVGGDSQIKNIGLLYQIAKIAQSQGLNIKFVLIGCRANKIPGELNNIEFRGVLDHDQVLSELMKSDMILVTSHTESFSIPAVTAYNLTKKIVGTKNSPFPNLFQKNFFPFDPANSEEAYKALVRAIEAPLQAILPIDLSPKKQSEKLLEEISDDIPIIIYHNGNQVYFKSAIANLVSKGYLPIIVCNQPREPKIEGALVVNLYGEQFEQRDVFASLYVHMSTNGKKNELVCFLRWFEILYVARKLNLKNFWHLDSDVLVFDEFLTYKKDIERLGISGIYIPEQRHQYHLSATAHVSLWSQDALESFVNFVLDSYKNQLPILMEKWNYHLTHQINGGICDMTLLYLWSRENQGIVKNIALLKVEKWRYNDNINIEVKDNLKLIKVIQKQSVHFLVEDYYSDNESCPALPFIHCQGRGKMLINLYSWGLSVPFGLLLMPTYFKLIKLVKLTLKALRSLSPVKI